MQILTTDHGNHPPDKWSQATARMILDISQVAPERQIAAQILLLKIAEALEPHFEESMVLEAAKLHSDPDHASKEHDARKIADKAVIAAKKAGKGTPWETLLNGNEWPSVAYTEILNILHSATHAERLWFADRNPDHKQAQAYKAAFHSKGN